VPKTLWAAIVLGLIAIAAIVYWRRLAGEVKQIENPTRGQKSDRNLVGMIAAAVSVLSLIFLAFASVVQVSTKNVAVVTSFGRPVGALNNGLHLKAPWTETTEYDAAIQTDQHTTDNKNTCVKVRIAHQTIACVDVTDQWRINEDAVDGLYQNYRGFDNVRDSLVTRQLDVALNTVFESYDPLAVDDNGNSTAPSLNTLASQVQTQMQAAVGNRLTVLSVMIPKLTFDDATQGRINALQAQIAQTRIAQQAEKTAAAQAAANKALSGSVSNDPNVLVDKCLNIWNEMVAKGMPLPAGSSCWGPSSASVAVPAK
jgi:regulator of protease activity HflC (stomatin/prohibitin superfamily)